jgi:hypothetical protein
MTTKIRKDKVAESISPLVTRVTQDEELRAHAKTALDSAKAIYTKIQADGPRKAATSKTVSDEVASEIRMTAERLSGKTQRKSRKFRKLLFGALFAGAAAVGLKKVLHRDEDEFEYEA